MLRKFQHIAELMINTRERSQARKIALTRYRLVPSCVCLPPNLSLPSIGRSAKILIRDQQLPISALMLERCFFQRDPVTCARELVGCKLTCGKLTGIVVETEAYDAEGDDACHTAFRPSARALRWFFSTGRDRTIFPAGDAKVADWVDNALLTNPNLTEHWLQNALVLLPDHPLLHIALAAFETDAKRADFLRSFGLARLPRNSAVCTRAGEMLLAQHGPELALAAVDRALLTDPTAAAAQRLRLRILDAMPR